MIYGYVRYNASDNENKNQQETLLKEAGVNKIFYDVGSGLDLLRPGLKELLRTAKRGDTILVTKYHKLVRGFAEQIIFRFTPFSPLIQLNKNIFFIYNFVPICI